MRISETEFVKVYMEILPFLGLQHIYKLIFKKTLERD